MGNKPLLGISLGLLLLVLAVGLRYFGDGPSVKTVESDADGHADHSHQSEHHLHPMKSGVATSPKHIGHDHNDAAINHDELPEALRKDLNERLKNNTRSDDLEVVTMPDGSKMSNLQGRFKHVPVAIKQPDGTTVIKEFYTAPSDNNQSK